MELPTYFTKFLQGIRPTKNQRDNCKKGHQKLRDRLEGYEDLKQVLVSTFPPRKLPNVRPLSVQKVRQN